MTEDLEIVQQSQLQKDEAFYNMSYREAFQSAMERTDPEAKKLGFQLGYTLLSSNAKLEGFNWTARVLELDDKSLESQSSSNMETIGEVLETNSLRNRNGGRTQRDQKGIIRCLHFPQGHHSTRNSVLR